jgi:prepilin-type N-terminal cleavage/methylation domain-containing protein
MFSGHKGTSLIEVMVALTILSVGLLGLVGASATVTALLGRGRWATVTTSYAERRLELLRRVAGDSAGCAAVAGGSSSLPQGLAESWSISPGIGSLAVEVVVTGRGARADTLAAVLPCG